MDITNSLVEICHLFYYIPVAVFAGGAASLCLIVGSDFLRTNVYFSHARLAQLKANEMPTFARAASPASDRTTNVPVLPSLASLVGGPR